MRIMEARDKQQRQNEIVWDASDEKGKVRDVANLNNLWMPSS